MGHSKHITASNVYSSMETLKQEKKELAIPLPVQLVSFWIWFGSAESLWTMTSILPSLAVVDYWHCHVVLPHPHHLLSSPRLFNTTNNKYHQHQSNVPIHLCILQNVHHLQPSNVTLKISFVTLLKLHIYICFNLVFVTLLYIIIIIIIIKHICKAP